MIVSVDIDIVYCDRTKSRDEALADIVEKFGEIRDLFGKRGFTVIEPRSTSEEYKLLVRRGHDVVKVEINTVFRGTVLDPEVTNLRSSAIDMFKRNARVPILAKDEVYAGKLVAAMDRQHPRDLFDVLMLREMDSGISDRMRQVFLVYVSGHNRPINEILTPNKKDISQIFSSDFDGMTKKHIPLEDLIEVRDWLFETLPASLTPNERQYLRTLKAGDPDWSLLPFGDLGELSGVKWKLKNIEKLKKTNPAKYEASAKLLDEKLTNIP